jgi:hypothetical protein
MFWRLLFLLICRGAKVALLFVCGARYSLQPWALAGWQVFGRLELGYTRVVYIGVGGRMLDLLFDH